MINQPQLAKSQAALKTRRTPDKVTSINNAITYNQPDKVTKAHTELPMSIFSNQLNTATEPEQDKPTEHTQKNNKSASFLMGLNTRLAKQEARINRLESNFAQLSKHAIGYKELGLASALSVLVFTSLGLVFTMPESKQDIELKILEQLNPTEKIIQGKDDVSFLTRFISHPNIKNWLSSTKIHPTPISIASNYKWPLERQLKTKQVDYNSYKHGINLNAKLGDPVVAIAAGTVLFSNNNIADYGNLILVQHDNHVISVYGNNYSNYVKKGQKVNKGELLAAVGETNGNQPRLYFEIRYQGKAQDPFLYFQ
jgi:murein DD-endopeptidase MepM/ murein hydrolase activator NlpD